MWRGAAMNIYSVLGEVKPTDSKRKLYNKMENINNLPEIKIDRVTFKIPKRELKGISIVEWLCKKWGLKIDEVHLEVTNCFFTTDE